jgi:hypothetical protein
MGSKNKAEVVRILCHTIGQKSEFAGMHLKAEIHQNLDETNDFKLLRQQTKSYEIHHKIYHLAKSLEVAVPNEIDDVDEIGSLAEIADLQLVNLDQCLVELEAFATLIQPIWSSKSAQVTAVESPSVESPAPLEDDEGPFEEAVDEASKQGVI